MRVPSPKLEEIAMIHNLVFISIGIVAGSFMPAVGRKIKSWFVTEAKKV